jgi:hypothetical protein
MACARSREGTMPRSTRSLSILIFMASIVCCGFRRVDQNLTKDNEHAALTKASLDARGNIHDL